MPRAFARSIKGALCKRFFTISLCFTAAILAAAGCGGGPRGGGGSAWTVASLDLTGAQALVIDQSGSATRELCKITTEGQMVPVDYLDGAGQPLPSLPTIHPIDWLYHVNDQYIIIPLAREASIKTFLIDKSTGAATDITAAGIPFGFQSLVDQSRRMEVQTDLAGNIYFISRTDPNSGRLIKIDTAHGNAVTLVSPSGVEVYTFRVDSAGNIVYALSGNRFVVINAAGDYVTTFQPVLYEPGHTKTPYNCFVGLDDKFYFSWNYGGSIGVKIERETILGDGTLQTPNEVYGTVPPGASGQDDGWFAGHSCGATEVRMSDRIYYLDKTDGTLCEVYTSTGTPALYPPVYTYLSFSGDISIVDYTSTTIYAFGQNGATGVIVTYVPGSGATSHSIPNLTFDQAVVLEDGTIYFTGEYSLKPVLGKISTDYSVSVIKENADIMTIERL